MAFITLDEFLELVKQPWKHSQVVDTIGHEDCEGGELPNESTPITGFAEKISELGEFRITYQEGIKYLAYNSGSFEKSTDWLEQVWTVEGPRIIDEEGLEVPQYLMGDYLPPVFSEIDYTELYKELNVFSDVHLTKGIAEEELTTILVDGKPNLRFKGELVGFESSSTDRNIEWADLSIYRTIAGGFVAQFERVSSWHPNILNESKAEVCSTEEEVRSFFRGISSDLINEELLENLYSTDPFSIDCSEV